MILRAAAMAVLLASAAAAQDFRTLLEQAGDDPAEWRSIRDQALAADKGIARLMTALIDRAGRVGPVPRENAMLIVRAFARVRGAFDSAPDLTKAALRDCFDDERRAVVAAYVASWLDLGGDFVSETITFGEGMLVARVPDGPAFDNVIRMGLAGRAHATSALAFHPADRAREAFWKYAAHTPNPAHPMAYMRYINATPKDLAECAAQLASRPRNAEPLLWFVAARGRPETLEKLAGLSYEEPQLAELLTFARAGCGDEAATKALVAMLDNPPRGDLQSLLAILARGGRPEGRAAVKAKWDASGRDERFGFLEFWVDAGDPAAVEAARTVLADPEYANAARPALARWCWRNPPDAEQAFPAILDAAPDFCAELAPGGTHAWRGSQRAELMDAILAAAERSEKHRRALLDALEIVDPWEVGFRFAGLEEAKRWWEEARERSETRGW